MDKNKEITVAKIFKLALENHQANMIDVAQNLYNQVLEIDPTHTDATNNLGIIFKELGENQKAKECFEKTIAINPNYAAAHNNLGTSFNNLRQYQKAKDCYEKAIAINPNYADAHYNHGRSFNNLRQYQKAKECFEKTIAINPNYADAHNNLGIIFKELGENQNAKECFEKTIAINPNYAGAHNNLGIILKELGENQKAKECFEKAIAINPNNPNYYNNLGIIFKELGENQKAKSCYKKAIAINPNYADAYNNLGTIFKELGENQKTKSCYKKAIAINPNNPNYYNNLGIIFKELGEYQNAKSCYEKAIELSPNSPNYYNNLGTIFKELGENQKTKSCYEKAIELDPNYPEPYANLLTLQIKDSDNFEKSIATSYKSLSLYQKKLKFTDHSVPLFRLKHDVQQARYLDSKNYKVNGINNFKKVGSEILNRVENEKNHDKNILLTASEINALLPFYTADFVYQPKIISGSCINPYKNWQDVEDQYFNSKKQIIYIDDFLSVEALRELREFCLVSKVWNKIYKNKYLGAFSDQGFISPIHLQISLDLQKQLPKLFGPHKIEKFWGFKYDSVLGNGINIHADFAIHNLNFWITPDEYNNNKNLGGLKVYDVPAPENWTFNDFNTGRKEIIYQFLKNNNANCNIIPYKFNRAVLFNSAYFHETDKIDFKDVYEGRRINNTYLFGNRLVNKIN